MKLSLCSANYGKTDLKRIIYRAAELGFDGIELTVMFHVLPTIDYDERKKITTWLEDAGIKCSAIHFIFDESVKLSSTRKDDIKYSIKFMKNIINLAADLGAPTIVVGGGGTRSIKKDQNKDEVVKNLVSIFTVSGKYAAEKNIVLAIEPLNRYETNFIRTLKDASEFVEKINLPNVKIMGDTFHMNIDEISIEDAIINYRDKLAHLHLADSNRLAPGEGHIDFSKIVEALKKSNYKGYCSFEVFYISPDLVYIDSYEEADMHMFNGINYMRKLLK